MASKLESGSFSKKKLLYFFDIFILVSIFLGMVVGYFLKPSPFGYGTHQALGLPKCLIASLLHIAKCPSCGLTTSFSHFMKGNFTKSFDTNFLIIFVIIYILFFLYGVFYTLLQKKWDFWQKSLLPLGIYSILIGIIWIIRLWWLMR